MGHKDRLFNIDDSSHTSDSAANPSRHRVPQRTAKSPDQAFYDLELIGSTGNSFPEVDIVIVHDIQPVRRSRDLVTSGNNGFNFRSQQLAPPEPEAVVEAGNLIAQSIDDPFNGLEVPEKEKEADAALSNLRTHRELSEENRLQIPKGLSVSTDTIHYTEQQEQTDEHQRKDRPLDFETRSSSQPSEVHHIDWLRNAEMLQSDIHNARILAYSYYSLSPDDTSSPAEYLINVARNLVLQLAEGRELDGYHKVPIIFIGDGFGCVVLQEMITLLSSTEQLDGKTILRLTAGTIFLYAPSHTLGHRAMSGSDTDNQGTNATEYWMLESNPSKNVPPIDAQKIWTDFLDVTKNMMMSVVWFYNQSAKIHNDDVPGVLFESLRSKTKSHGYSSRRDRDYEELIDQVNNCLVFKLSSDWLLAENLRRFFDRHNFAASARDYHGQTPLHWASLKHNLYAVELLTTRIEGMALARDKFGQTPLHVAVIQASKIEKPTDEDQEEWKYVICELMKNQINVDIKDKLGKSAWDYADDKKRKWIKKLKNERSWVTGLLTSTSPKTWEPLDKPRGLRLSVCRKVEAGLFEFFWDPRSGEKLNAKSQTILRLLYKDREEGLREGLERIFSASRPPDLEPQCRWIHLPANNEQWIHDLFTKLRVRDNSMIGQRYEGRQEYARHMVAQARLYQHFREKPNELKNSQDRDTRGPDMQSSSRGEAVLFAESEPSVIPPQPDILADTALVIFMPILGFETHRHRKYLSRAINGAFYGDYEGISSLLLRGYMHDPASEKLRPLHCRRTLDQCGYYSLDSTERRDMDQVIYRWAKNWRENIPAKHRPILMVDQLWLWVLNDGTVITSVSDTWSRNEPFSFESAVQEELRNKERPFIKSAEDLAHMVLRTSIDFFDREGPLNSKLPNCFQSSINGTSDKHDSLFKTFRGIVKLLSTPGLDQAGKTELMDRLLSLNTDTECLIEIMDIQDELMIINSVLSKQREVLEKMLSFYTKENVSPTDAPPDLHLDSDNDHHRRENPGIKKTNQKKQFFGLEQDRGQQDEQDEKKRRENERKFSLSNRDLMIKNIGIVDKNIMTVKDMIKHAEHVKTELDSLLRLTEKQVNAWEIQAARKGSDETREQGNIIVVFTLVTIILLPLSFLSSFFALSIDKFPKDPESGNTSWPLSEVSGYLVGITTALSVFFISLAFKANAIRSWLKRHTAKLHYPEEKLKRKKSSHFKEIDVYNEVEDSDKENIDEEDIRQDEDFIRDLASVTSHSR